MVSPIGIFEVIHATKTSSVPSQVAPRVLIVAPLLKSGIKARRRNIFSNSRGGTKRGQSNPMKMP